MKKVHKSKVSISDHVLSLDYPKFVKWFEKAFKGVEGVKPEDFKKKPVTKKSNQNR